MALEDALSQLNANILTLIEVIQKSDSQRAEIVDKAEAVLKRKAGDSATTTTTKATTTKKDEPKSEPEPETNSEAPAEDAGAVEEAKKAVAEFVREGKTEDDTVERKKEVRARLTKLGLKEDQRVGELDPASAKRLVASLAKLTKTYVPIEDRKPAGDDLDDI